MDLHLDQTWKEVLKAELQQDYFAALQQFLISEYASAAVYPIQSDVFRAFNECPVSRVKVVIVGQDPYHGPNQANGLCFSVSKGIPQPPSLKNIFKELEADLGQGTKADSSLLSWAQQGVLLLNATLTVRSGQAASHAGHGWEQFTDTVLRYLDQHFDHLVFILWGNYAQKKGIFLDRKRHEIIESTHPSPLSAYRGFFGSKPFSRSNNALITWGMEPIRW